MRCTWIRAAGWFAHRSIKTTAVRVVFLWRPLRTPALTGTWIAGGPASRQTASGMNTHRTSLAGGTARIVWGGLALVLLVALLASVFLSRGTIDDAERQAEARAVDWVNTVLFDALTPDEVQAPILGPDYPELLITVQAGIRSDDRTARVRIWNADGVLVFSDDQGDKIGDFVVTSNPQIEAALSGKTVSVPTPATVAPTGGLAGSDEKLFQTFVPLRLENQLGISGVVEIDQRYSAIEAEASNVWQMVRLGLVIALTIAVGLFLFALRGRPVAIGAGEMGRGAPPTRRDARALKHAAKAEEQLQIVSERAEAAEAARAEAESGANEAIARLRDLEERASQAEEQARSAEAALKAAVERMTGGGAPRRGVPGVGAVAVPAAAAGLEAKLEATQAEQTQLLGEVGRLRAALSEREAELEQRTTEGTRQPADAEARIAELEERATDLETAHARTTRELEAARVELAKADTELAAAREVLAEMGSAAREIEARATRSEARAAEVETARATLAAELDRVRAEASRASAPVIEEGDAESLRRRVAELEEARRTDVTELQRAQQALANTQFESSQALRRVKELEEQLELARATPAAGAEEVAMPAGEEPPSFAPRSPRLVSEQEPGAEPEPAESVEVDESTLSLRERLARAAAARHRAPGTPSPDD